MPMAAGHCPPGQPGAIHENVRAFCMGWYKNAIKDGRPLPWSHQSPDWIAVRRLPTFDPDCSAV